MAETKHHVNAHLGRGEELKAEDYVFPDVKKFGISVPMDIHDAIHAWGSYRGEHTLAEFRDALTAIAKRKGTAYVNALPDKWRKEMAKQEEDRAAKDEGYTVKAAGDWELDILGVPFGDAEHKDAQGEYFTNETQYHEDRYGLPPLVYYHGLDAGGRPSGDPEYIGKTVKRWVDKAGIWFRGVLDKTNALAKRVWEAAQQEKARASSGSIAHLTRTDPDGKITEWPVAELSVFDLGGGRRPANPYAVAMPAMRAIWAKAGLEWPDDELPELEAADEAGPASPEDDAAKAQVDDQGVREMEAQEIQKIVADALAADRAARDAEAKAAAEKQAAIDTAVKAATDKLTAEWAAKSRLPYADGAPVVAKFGEIRKFDNWEMDDLACWIAFTNQALKAGNVKAQRLGDNIYRALAIRIQSEGEKSEPGRNGLKTLNAYLPQVVAMKSDEVMQYDLSGYGDEWARVLYSDNLWYRLRFGTPVLDKMNPYMIQLQGAETMWLLLEGSTDAAWYKVAEVASNPTTELTGVPNATFPSSRMATARQQVTLGKIGARVMISGELSESTPLAVVSEVRKNMEVSGREAIENVLLNGDTDATINTNINDVAGTPDADELFLVANGFRKLPLITNTANARSGTTLAIEDYLSTLQLMGTAGVNALAQPDKVSFIVDPSTYAKSMGLAELKTQDVYNPGATVLTGRLPRVYGSDVILSAQFCKVSIDGAVIANSQLTEATGKIDTDTASDNTVGGILAVRWDQWRMGYRRMMQFEATRVARADLTELVSLAEIGIVYRDTEASALSYNITI